MPKPGALLWSCHQETSNSLQMLSDHEGSCMPRKYLVSTQGCTWGFLICHGCEPGGGQLEEASAHSPNAVLVLCSLQQQPSLRDTL